MVKLQWRDREETEEKREEKQGRKNGDRLLTTSPKFFVIVVFFAAVVAAMKATLKESEKWEQIRSPNGAASVNTHSRVASAGASKLMLWLILLISVTYALYTVRLVSHRHYCSSTADDVAFATSKPRFLSIAANQLAANLNDSAELTLEETDLDSNSRFSAPESPPPTNISHIVFGIAASSKLWEKRKEYIKLWYKPESGMRGAVWLDSPVISTPTDINKLPPVQISGDTSKFAYRNRQGHRSAIRISRIVSETLRLGMKNVRWIVLGDDDTVFVTENLVRVLSKYDHNQFYYIGSSSESHLQNIYFSYAMAYGGGGFAISYPLALALSKMQDRCIQRYPHLYGSDDRMQACMAELGVPLTKELGFHQYDVYGSLFGLLGAHPVTPLVSLHHLDVVEPVFPGLTRVDALQRLIHPMKVDSAGLMQQSICYDRTRQWTVSVSWGYAVQVVRGILSPREMEMPTRTFLNWYKRADYTAYAFNTRPVARNPCQKPYVFYFEKLKTNSWMNKTVSEYAKHPLPQPVCKWNIEDPDVVKTVSVNKAPDPQLWDRSPRRNCCRIKSSKDPQKMVIDVGVCKDGEITEV
ncbi:hypothetical protein V2J09_020223 [Rumex salicifolius]